jgi:hydroxyacylglutathione hydrolase
MVMAHTGTILSAWLHFFKRPYPSANMVLIGGKHPILVDTGFGSDLAITEQMIREKGVAPERLSLIVNTHYHVDHTGGNHGLQQRYRVPIAAHRWEAVLVNLRNADACNAEWLDQPIEPYEVNWMLSEGDILDAGDGLLFEVLHTPGHTLGHISLYNAEAQCLICGDVVHSDDVAWLCTFREGVGALQRMLETFDKLTRLPLRVACSGHGPLIEQPLAAFDAARRRYEKWLHEPEKVGWHACKRIFAYALMLKGGIPADEVAPFLLQRGWFLDYARYVFRTEPADFVQPLLQEMLRSGAAGWRDGCLVALTPFTPVPPDWACDTMRPRYWPIVKEEG